MQLRSVRGDEAQSKVDPRHAALTQDLSNGVFSGGHGGERFSGGTRAVRQAREQAGASFLPGQTHAGAFGKRVYIVLGQSRKCEGGNDAEFSHGAQARTIALRVGSVGSVAQRKIARRGQRGEHGALAFVAAVFFSAAYGGKRQRIDGNFAEFKAELRRPCARERAFFRRNVRT